MIVAVAWFCFFLLKPVNFKRRRGWGRSKKPQAHSHCSPFLSWAPATGARAGRDKTCSASQQQFRLPVDPEHRGREVQRLKCRDFRSGRPAAGHSEKEWGGVSPQRQLGNRQTLTTMKEACRAQSPFSWALSTPLRQSSVSSSPREESSGVKEMAREGRKCV